MAKNKVGIINVGQGPRKDYVSIHRNWFNYLGADVEIIERAALDGLSCEELYETEGPPYDPEKPLYSPDTRCGAWIHRQGSYNKVLGKDWWEVWTPRKDNIPRIQKCIDSLEQAGAELIIMCCCLEYPENAFKSKVPFILPWKVTFDYVKALADTMHKPEIGVLIGREQNWERDVEMWTRRRWTRDVNFHFEMRNKNGKKYNTAKLPPKLDLLIIWGHQSFDLKGGVVGDECLALQLGEQFNCPVISSMSAALLFARGLLRPPINELSFYTPMDK
ncbi:hypothetical protein ES705_45951 [subsurface metagenome]